MNDLYGPLDEKRKKRKKAGTESSKESSLKDWFGRKGAKGKKKGWVDCNAPDGKGGYKACGRGSGEKRKKYPACRPTPGACKERGKGKSWGKKSKKSKKNEELYRMDLYQIIEEEIEAVVSEIRTDGRGYSPATMATSKALAQKGIATKPESVRRRLMQLVADLDLNNPTEEEVQQLADLVSHLMGAAQDADEYGLEESHSKDDEKMIKDIIKQLRGAVKAHGKQADSLQKIVDDSPDEELKEGMNCGCGKDPCKTYGKNNEKLIIMVKEELEAVLGEAAYEPGRAVADIDTGEEYMSPPELEMEEMRDLADKFNVGIDFETSDTDTGETYAKVTLQNGETMHYHDSEEMYRDLAKNHEMSESTLDEEEEGKKDACYHKVKSRYEVWPSAYASGALVKCRDVGADNWGNSKKESFNIIIEDELTRYLSELRCWDGHQRVKGKTPGAPGSCEKIKEVEIDLKEKKKKKACKPSKGKRFAKRVDGKCRSFGQKGQAKGGGDRIRPGTKKGDAYCARSAKIKKCKNPPCANALSRKKWKCRGSKSMKEAVRKINAK